MRLHAGVWAHTFLYSFLPLFSFALDPAELHRELDQVADAESFVPGVAPLDEPKVEVKTSGVVPISQPQSIPISAQQMRSRVEAVAENYQAPANPVLQLYVQETKQYLKDATEAEKAAEMYAKMSQELIKTGALKATTQSLTRQEMGRVGARLWAHSVYAFEKMLLDKSGSIGMAAAAKGGIPYQKMVDAYTKQQGVFDSAAQGYALRVSEILPVSKKLMTYANQYRLQGNDKMADDYDNQAASLMKQAEAFAAESKKRLQNGHRAKRCCPRHSKNGWHSRRKGSVCCHEGGSYANTTVTSLPFHARTPA